MSFLTHPEVLNLVKAVHAQPDDDLARLVLCDRLEELAEPEGVQFAAHMRLQIAMTEIWPMPDPPKELDLIPDPVLRKQYWTYEQQAFDLRRRWRDWLGVGRRTREGSVLWRRGMPHFSGTVQSWVDQWRKKPCWSWFTGVTLTSPSGFSTAKIAGPLAEDLLAGVVTDLEFGEGFSCYSALDVTRVAYLTALSRWDQPNLRRLTFGVHYLDRAVVDMIHGHSVVRGVKGLTVAVKLLGTFTGRHVHRLQALTTCRLVVDTSACAGGTPQPGL